MAKASEMADSEVSDDMIDDNSEPDTESPSKGEGENTEFTSSDDESTVYDSKEKRRRKHNYDTSMVDLKRHINCERDYERPLIPLNQLQIWKVCVPSVCVDSPRLSKGSTDYHTRVRTQEKEEKVSKSQD